MALGDTTEVRPDLWAFELLASATATNSPPSGASAGLDVGVIVGKLGFLPPQMGIVLASTAGSATMTATVRLWGYLPTIGSGLWLPMGTGTDSLKGVLNDGTAIGETGTDTIRHFEVVNFPSLVARFYLEITAIGGTSTAVTSWLIGGKGRSAHAAMI